MEQNRHTRFALAGVAAIAAILILGPGLWPGPADARQVKPQFTGNENHAISLDLAAKYIRNFSAQPTVPTIKGGYFGRSTFGKLLAQKGCVGIRFYYAKTDSGEATMVLVGVDSSGDDLYGGVLAEQIIPCPPWCPTSNPLNK